MAVPGVEEPAFGGLVELLCLIQACGQCTVLSFGQVTVTAEKNTSSPRRAENNLKPNLFKDAEMPQEPP